MRITSGEKDPVRVSAAINDAARRLDTTDARGTTTNDNANAGNIGEYLSSIVPAISAVALTTGTAANITSLNLTAGDWDVEGNIGFLPAAGTTVTHIVGLTNTVSATLPADLLSGVFSTLVPTTGTQGDWIAALGSKRYSLAATTTVYLIAFANFGVSTNAAYGMLRARRVR